MIFFIFLNVYLAINNTTMITEAVDLNYWAILVGAVSAMVVGSIWYAKPVFGKKWQQAVGMKDEDMKQGANKAMSMMTVFALLTSYVMAHIVDYAGATNWLGGVQTGFWIWLGFILTGFLGNALFEKRNMTTVYIFLGNQAVTLVVMGAILAAWQ